MRLWLPLVLLAAALPAAARVADSPRPLSECLELVDSDPERALEEAYIWSGEGGGLPADQCAAQAMTALGAYREAATRFEEMASGREAAGPAERTAFFVQAGNAWLLAQTPDRAKAAFDSALALTPGAPEILFDRARAHAMARNWKEAEADLTAVLRREPAREDALVLRGAARRAQGDADGARADIDAAVARNPQNQEALVERGGLRLAGGDAGGARADFLAAAVIDPETPAGRTAQEALARLDVKVDE